MRGFLVSLSCNGTEKRIQLAILNAQDFWLMAAPFSNILAGVYNDSEPKSGVSGTKFHRLCSVVEALNKASLAPEELEKAAEIADARALRSKTYQHFTEYSMIAAHIRWLKTSSISNSDRHIRGGTVLRLEEEGYISSQSSLSDSSQRITFWLPEHERQTFLRSSESINSRAAIFDELDGDYFLPEISEKVVQLWPQNGPAMFVHSLDAKVHLRNEFMKFAHKQFLQNVMCHAFADRSHNQNFTKPVLRDFEQLGKDHLFGSIAYLEYLLIDPSRDHYETSMSELEALHPLLVERYSMEWDELVSKRSKLLLVSYCDTGPGLERHYIQFGSNEADTATDITTKEIIDGRLTGRSAFGSGQGLNDVRKLAANSGATLIFETQQSLYYCDPQNANEHNTSSKRTPRGTCVSIVVEI